MKIRPLGAELVHAGGRTDGRTDITKLIVVFRNFTNEPEKKRQSSKPFTFVCVCVCVCFHLF